MSWITVAAAGAAVVGSVVSSQASKKAANAQSGAAENAAQTQLDMYNQSRADLAPWREAGSNALSQLQPMISAGPGQFTESPSYQFALQQGQQGIQRAASATGRLGSGAYIKDATKYAEGMASQEYGNFLQRYYDSLKPYQSLAGLGQTSAGQQAAVNTNTGNSLANTYQYGGNAQAQGYMGAAYPWTQNINQIPNYVGAYQAGQPGNALSGYSGYNPSMMNYGSMTSYNSQPSYNPTQMNSMNWL